jgi:hypothetical protein
VFFPAHCQTGVRKMLRVIRVTLVRIRDVVSTRNFQMALSTISLGVGDYLVASTTIDYIDDGPMIDNHYQAQIGTVLIIAGLTIHPGNVGNPDVDPPHRRLIPAMVHDTFGDVPNLLWTLGRILSMFMLAVFQTASGGNGAPVLSFISSGASLIPYAADRAWGSTRLVRSHPHAGNRHMAGAMVSNFITGNILDISALILSQGLAYTLRNMTGAFPRLTAGDLGQILRPMIATMVCGTLTSQLITFGISRSRWASSPPARMFAHSARLASRSAMRVVQGGHSSDEWVNVAADIVSAFTTHRWTESTADVFVRGLQQPLDSPFRNTHYRHGQDEPEPMHIVLIEGGLRIPALPPPPPPGALVMPPQIMPPQIMPPQNDAAVRIHIPSAAKSASSDKKKKPG